MLKGTDLTNSIHYRIAFFTHVYTSLFLVLIGLFQFWNHDKFKHFHKPLGIIYVFIILFLSAPSGLIMSFYANGGVWSKLSFVILTVLWFLFTYFAYKYAKKRDWINHQKFMLRSYALTLSAISLRLFKWIIVSTLMLPPMDTYKIVAWLGWGINLLVVEIYIYYKFAKKGTKISTF